MPGPFSELAFNLQSGIIKPNPFFSELESALSDAVSREYLSRFHNLPDFDSEKKQHLHYSSTPFEEIKDAALNHYTDYTVAKGEGRISSSKPELQIVHPFWPYISFSGLDIPPQYAEQFEQDLERFASLIDNLLSDERIRSAVSVVVRDFPESYALATSSLLEKGLIDDVVFTQFLRGKRLFPEDLSGKSIIFAGAYVGQCLDAAILDDQINNLPWERTYLLSDAVIHGPETSRKVWLEKWYAQTSNPRFVRPLLPEGNIIDYISLKETLFNNG